IIVTEMLISSSAHAAKCIIRHATPRTFVDRRLAFCSGAEPTVTTMQSNFQHRRQQLPPNHGNNLLQRQDDPGQARSNAPGIRQGGLEEMSSAAEIIDAE